MTIFGTMSPRESDSQQIQCGRPEGGYSEREREIWVHELDRGHHQISPLFCKLFKSAIQEKTWTFPDVTPRSEDSTNIARFSPVPRLLDQFIQVADYFDMREN
jgi:hypothetical protein